MILYHASKVVVEFPDIRKTKYTKDFSWGFYCTNNLGQAVRWANRGDGDPIINYYTYKPVGKLSILKFDQMNGLILLQDAEVEKHIPMILWKGRWQMIQCGIT